LIYQALSAISALFSDTESIFLPALREALRFAVVPAAAVYADGKKEHRK
jgi:hypothetical protein